MIYLFLHILNAVALVDQIYRNCPFIFSAISLLHLRFWNKFLATVYTHELGRDLRMLVWV